jgi:hypothetical protein
MTKMFAVFRRSFGWATIAVLAVGCSSGEDTSLQSSQNVSLLTSGPPTNLSTTQLVNLVAAPATMTAFSVKSLPNADCLLQTPGSESAPLELFSDTNGNTNFSIALTATGNTNAPLALSLNCEDSNGASSSGLIQISLGSAANATSAPPIVPVGTPRPALSGDPMSYLTHPLNSRPLEGSRT